MARGNFYLKKASHLADIPDWIFFNLGIAYKHHGNYQTAISIYKNFSKNHHNEISLFRLSTLYHFDKCFLQMTIF